MNGLNEKAAIDNILIDLKDKIKKSNTVEPRRDSYRFNDKEGKEIHKMFNKFKIITDKPNEDMLDTHHFNKHPTRSLDPNKNLHGTDDNYFADISFEDIQEYQKKLSERIQMKKIDEFMNEVKDFNKKAAKFSNNLGYIACIIEGDTSKIDVDNKSVEQNKKPRGHGRIYNYSKYVDSLPDNTPLGTKLEVAGAYYWRERGILFLSFLTR